MLIKSLCLLANLSLATSPSSEKISESLGHLLGKHLEELGLELDLKALAKGLEDEAAGKNAPLAKEDCLQAIQELQEKKKEEISHKNLSEAEEFLARNKMYANVQSIIEGKLQCQILREGMGEEIQPYNSPIVRIKGTYLNGQSFSENEELLSLEEAIPAFRLGLVGMKQGELRTLYVHPDFGYGTEGHLAPNALLIFEVEVIRADAGADEEIPQKEIPFIR